jgi:hypothetical protein
VVISFLWAFREFLICGEPCPSRPAVITARTQEAVAMTVWLAINLLALLVFLLNRRRIGLLVLGGVQVADVAITLGFGLILAMANDFSSGLAWWAGSPIAAVAVLLLYLRARETPRRSTP